MSRSTAEKSARPIIERVRWPLYLIWLVPVLAVLLAGYYVYLRLEERATEITIRFSDGTGLKPGESKVMHLGVQIGLVSDIQLSDDQKQVLVKVRLERPDVSFAREGSVFWIVRPEISTQEISGLGTVLSGPIIDGIAGSGEKQTDFVGLDKPPPPVTGGLSIVLKTPNVQRLQADSPVYFRGIQVGLIEDVQLSDDAGSAQMHALIERRYAPLVRENSEFWAVSAVDVKGGIFTGVQLKVESLRAMLSGGVAFATPDEKMGEAVRDGAAFALYDEPKKEWLGWDPKIAIGPVDSGDGNIPLPQPKTRQAIQSAVGSKDSMNP